MSRGWRDLHGTDADAFARTWRAKIAICRHLKISTIPLGTIHRDRNSQDLWIGVSRDLLITTL
jgi:hypothetical protein